MTYILDGHKRDIKIPNRGLRIVTKKRDKYIQCSRYGYAYDSRVIKKQWLK